MSFHPQAATPNPGVRKLGNEPHQEAQQTNNPYMYNQDANAAILALGVARKLQALQMTHIAGNYHN